MRMQISQNDVKNLTGKFIIQLDSHNEDVVLSDENWNFYQEKRISFVCGLSLVGCFYEHKKFDTEEDFVLYFNEYISNPSSEYCQKNKGTRFHRLLTSKELDFVFKKMKEKQY